VKTVPTPKLGSYCGFLEAIPGLHGVCTAADNV